MSEIKVTDLEARMEAEFPEAGPPLTGADKLPSGKSDNRMLLPSHPLVHQPAALEVVLKRHAHQVPSQNPAKPDGVHFPAEPDHSHLRPGWIQLRD